MSNRKNENHWFILLAVIVILLLVIAFTSWNSESIKEREAEVKRRNEEEEKLINELRELECEKHSYVEQEAVNAFNEKYMNDLCEKRYRQLIQTLIVLLVISNTIIYFTVPKMEILQLFTWNGVALGAFNILAIFFFANVKKGKEYLKGLAMNYIEFRVYENRDRTYFTQKVRFYQEEIERVKQEIKSKSTQLEKIRESSPVSVADSIE
jgi:hypothetical protein